MNKHEMHLFTNGKHKKEKKQVVNMYKCYHVWFKFDVHLLQLYSDATFVENCLQSGATFPVFSAVKLGRLFHSFLSLVQ